MARPEDPFALDEFLARPLVARVATTGPTVRPVWFLWEDGAFWWITGTWSALAGHLSESPEVALVIDTCDLTTGAVHQVLAWGNAEVVPMDLSRARRKLIRYLGPDERTWDTRFQLPGDPKSRLIRLIPEHLEVYDLSFKPS